MKGNIIIVQDFIT